MQLSARKLHSPVLSTFDLLLVQPDTSLKITTPLRKHHELLEK
jgi:hypothetical protein